MWKYAIGEMDEITYKDLACELIWIFSHSVNIEDIKLLSGAKYIASAVIKKQLGNHILEIFTPLYKSHNSDKSYCGLSQLEVAIDGRHYLISRTWVWYYDFHIVCPYMEDDSSDVYVNKTDEQRFLYDLKLLCELALMLCGENNNCNSSRYIVQYYLDLIHMVEIGEFKLSMLGIDWDDEYMSKSTRDDFYDESKLRHSDYSYDEDDDFPPEFWEAVYNMMEK
jgi:hypothetical protein